MTAPDYSQILNFIGHTPIIQLSKNVVPAGAADVFVKLEYFNAAGSVKDRVAIKLIADAEEKGLINKDTILIEATSGNTGVGIAAAAAALGYKATIALPESASDERKKLIRAYGAELVETPASEGINGSFKVVEERLALGGYYRIGQFINQANPQAHYETTAPEIVEYFNGKTPDVFVAGVGTGGTITGVGHYLKEINPDVKIIAVEPAASPVLEGGKPGPHPIQGIGPGIIPDVLDTKVYDEIVPVTGDQAVDVARLLGRKEGILLGFSSGAAIYAAIEEAKKLGEGHSVLALAPDNGERYLSTPLFA
jgi:cysteine synthase A